MKTLTDSVRFPLAAAGISLVLSACAGISALPDKGQYDPNPRLQGGLTGNESIMNDTVGDGSTPASRAAARRDAAPAAAGIPASYRGVRSRSASYTPPLLSSRADTLENGAVVYWVEDAQLPIAQIRFLWNEGTLGLSPQEAVDAEMLGAMLREGGTETRPARWIDDTLEILGADVSIGIGAVRSTAEVQGFSRDVPFLLDMLEDMLRHPALDTARLSILKAESFQSVEHGLDAPAQVLDAAWNQVQYGPGPWTRRTDSLQVARLSPASLRARLAGRFDAKGCVVAVAGKVDRAAVRQKLSKMLSGAAGPELTRLPGLPAPHEAGVWIAPVEATQSFVKIGTRFVRRDHPDYYPLMLACQALGSGFGTRLVDRIRSDEGLAYHVGAFAGSDYDRVGTLGVDLQTKSVSTHRAVKLVFEEIRRLRDEGFRPGELDRARKGLEASLPTLFDTPEATAEIFAQSASWGRRDDHFRTYQKAIDTVSEATVLEVFRRWFKPEELRIVVAGPKDLLLGTPADGSPALSSYGPVHVLSKEDLLRSDDE
jgi:zinc protease